MPEKIRELLASSKRGTHERALYRVGDRRYELIVEKYAVLTPMVRVAYEEKQFIDVSEAMDALNNQRVR